MSKSAITIIIYIIGLIFGALILSLWDADINITKGGIAFGWTSIFLIALHFTDSYEKK
tara:strand:- start:1218 stop:1391 length:174 start_codon:yes stop_codon:yes gene_type:complete